MVTCHNCHATALFPARIGTFEPFQHRPRVILDTFGSDFKNPRSFCDGNLGAAWSPLKHGRRRVSLHLGPAALSLAGDVRSVMSGGGGSWVRKYRNLHAAQPTLRSRPDHGTVPDLVEALRLEVRLHPAQMGGGNHAL